MMSRRPLKYNQPIVAPIPQRLLLLYTLVLSLGFGDSFILAQRQTLNRDYIRLKHVGEMNIASLRRQLKIKDAMTCRPIILYKFYTSSLHTNTNESADQEQKQRKRDKVMNFLRRMGKIGPIKDFTTAIGVDEGPAAKAPGTTVERLNKVSASYLGCTVEQVRDDGEVVGIIDDLTEAFPRTTCGTQWSGFTDQVMGGVSIGQLTRVENIAGRCANVMKGKVSLYNNGGFIQMACNLSSDESGISPTVDASTFQGIEMDLFHEGMGDTENFNVQ